MLPVPVPLKVLLALFKLASFTSKVEATKPPTFTCEPCPKTMPFGLIKYTWPLAFSWPKICVALVSKMRLTAIAAAEGWTKLTIWLAAILKLFQFSDRFWLFCWIVVVVPVWAMLPDPAVTTPPLGLACAMALHRDNEATNNLLRVLLLPPRARPPEISETGIQACWVRLQTNR